MPTQPKFITTPDIAERLIEALTIGAYREEACDYAPLDRSSLLRWMERGEAHTARMETYQKALQAWEDKGGKDSKTKKPKQPDQEEAIYTAFAARVKRAEADARIAAITAVRTGFNQPGGKGWIAAMTYLERKDPKHWGRKDRNTNVNLNLDASKLDLTSLSDPELAMFNSMLNKLSPQNEGEE